MKISGKPVVATPFTVDDRILNYTFETVWQKETDDVMIPRGLKPKEETFQVVLDALALTPCYLAFLITADVPEVYMHQFWNCIYKHDDFYRFKIDKKKRFKLTLEVFRDIFQICPRVPGRDFDALPSEEDTISFLRDLGHTGVINSLNDVVIDQMHQPWRTFAAIINRSLSGKTSGLDKLRLSRAQILWGMYHQKYVDYVELLWEDFTYQIDNKVYKKQEKMYYPLLLLLYKSSDEESKRTRLILAIVQGKRLKDTCQKSASKARKGYVSECPPVETKSKKGKKEKVGCSSWKTAYLKFLCLKKDQMKRKQDEKLRTLTTNASLVVHSKGASWGNDEDDSNNEQESSDESSKQENESEIDQENEYEDDEMKSDEEQGMDDTTDQFDDDADARLEEPTLDSYWICSRTSKRTAASDSAQEVSSFAPPVIEKLIKESRDEVTLAKAMTIQFDLSNSPSLDPIGNTSKSTFRIFCHQQYSQVSSSGISTYDVHNVYYYDKAAKYDYQELKYMVPNLLEWMHSRGEMCIRQRYSGCHSCLGLMSNMVHGYLKDDCRDDVSNFAIALRMFTRSLVIQKRVEDLQLGVESYQKKINVTKPDNTRRVISEKGHRTLDTIPQGSFLSTNTKRISNMEYTCQERWKTPFEENSSFHDQGHQQAAKGKENDEEFRENSFGVDSTELTSDYYNEQYDFVNIVLYSKFDESDTYVLERFDTSDGNHVKEILLKLNLPDHRSILTDSKEYVKMVME
ncbi:hypothetical protein Tco_1274050, partial [Tanacetum coccineum]